MNDSLGIARVCRRRRRESSAWRCLSLSFKIPRVSTLSQIDSLMLSMPLRGDTKRVAKVRSVTWRFGAAASRLSLTTGSVLMTSDFVSQRNTKLFGALLYQKQVMEDPFCFSSQDLIVMVEKTQFGLQLGGKLVNGEAEQ